MQLSIHCAYAMIPLFALVVPTSATGHGFEPGGSGVTTPNHGENGHIRAVKGRADPTATAVTSIAEASGRISIPVCRGNAIDTNMCTVTYYTNDKWHREGVKRWGTALMFDHTCFETASNWWVLAEDLETPQGWPFSSVVLFINLDEMVVNMTYKGGKYSLLDEKGHFRYTGPNQAVTEAYAIYSRYDKYHDTDTMSTYESFQMAFKCT